MNRCYVPLVGGIGNQLFQIAAGYAYSRKYDKRLILDFSKWSASQGNHPEIYQNTIFKNFDFSNYHTNAVTSIHEKRFNYDELPYIEGDVSIHGYFQSIKYFEEYVDDFIDMLLFPKPSVEFLEDKNLAVHIRRGDYIQHAHIHLVCDTNFYIRNMEQFPNYQINIFTDSISSVPEEFKDVDCNIIQSSSALDDLTMMSLHDNIVCSNSSFSWWASLLGKKKERIIVPKVWFNNFEEHGDIYRTEFELSEV